MASAWRGVIRNPSGTRSRLFARKIKGCTSVGARLLSVTTVAALALAGATAHAIASRERTARSVRRMFLVIGAGSMSFTHHSPNNELRRPGGRLNSTAGVVRLLPGVACVAGALVGRRAVERLGTVDV